MSYKSSDLEPSADIVREADIFDSLREIQEQAMTITNACTYRNGKPESVVYPPRDIRLNIPNGFKTVLDTEYVKYNTIYKVKYTYAEEMI